MTYRLKDRDLQRKLDDISGGDFSVQLQKVSDTMLSSLTGPGVHFGGLARVVDDRFRHLAPRFTLRFHRDELEEVPDRPSEAVKAEVVRRIEALRGSLRRIERSLEEDQPDEVDVRWGFAKAIIMDELDDFINDYLNESKHEEEGTE